jgi:hypothetical protein
MQSRYSGYLYGEHVGAGTLTPYIHEAFNKNVRESVVLLQAILYFA